MRPDPFNYLHFTIHQRLENQVIVIGQQLVTKQFDLTTLKSFTQEPLERGEVLIV